VEFVAGACSWEVVVSFRSSGYCEEEEEGTREWGREGGGIGLGEEERKSWSEERRRGEGSSRSGARAVLLHFLNS